MEGKTSESPFAHLLWGISWEGRKVNKKYRDGGRGVEEVLTTEVLLGLEFLPRRPFSSYVIDRIEGDFSPHTFVSEEEIEALRFLPAPVGRHALRPSAPNHQAALDVQIDAMAETDRSRIFIEAKRIGDSSFQEEQLARTFIIALRESGNLNPRVLLILGEPPPVKVKKHGRLGIKEGILTQIPEVYEKTEDLDFSLEAAKARVDECVGWITWRSIAEAVNSGMDEYGSDDESTYASVERIASFIQGSIKWHG